MMNDLRIDINKVDKFGKTPFAIVGSKCYSNNILHLEIIKYMINDSRIDIDKVNHYGETPFANACKNDHLEIIKHLINDSRINVNKVNKNGETPFYIACRQSTMCSASVYF